MVKFIRGIYEQYWELYIGDEATPAIYPDGYDPETIYYLWDSRGHQHIFMNGKEYSVTSIVVDPQTITSQSYSGLQGICPVEVFLTQSEYEQLDQNGLIEEYVKYSIYVPDTPSAQE